MIIFVRNIVVKDFWLKLFSLALAILIWLTVQFTINGEGSPWVALFGHASDETVLTVDVQAPPGDSRIIGMDPPQVQVTLRGDPISLKNLRGEDIRAQVDMAAVQTADGQRPVEVILPRGIAYTLVTPDKVTVRVSPKTE